MVPSHFGFAYALLAENNPLPELVVISPVYALQTSLNDFSVLLSNLGTLIENADKRLPNHLVKGSLVRKYFQAVYSSWFEAAALKSE